MLNWIKRRPYFGTALFVSFVLAVLFFASFFVQFIAYACAPNEYTHTKECAPHHLGPFVLVWIGLVVDSHNGVVTAVATIVMAIFTGTLWFVTNKSVTLAREEFIATHRPKLRARQFMGPDIDEYGATVFIFIIANVGDSPATLKFFESSLVVTRESGGEHVPLVPIPFIPFRLAPGQAIKSTRRTVDPWDANTWVEFFSNTFNVRINGAVTYTDDNGIDRQTFFLRLYDASTQMYVKEGKGELDFED